MLGKWAQLQEVHTGRRAHIFKRFTLLTDRRVLGRGGRRPALTGRTACAQARGNYVDYGITLVISLHRSRTPASRCFGGLNGQIRSAQWKGATRFRCAARMPVAGWMTVMDAEK